MVVEWEKLGGVVVMELGRRGTVVAGSEGKEGEKLERGRGE